MKGQGVFSKEMVSGINLRNREELVDARGAGKMTVTQKIGRVGWRERGERAEGT